MCLIAPGSMLIAVGLAGWLTAPCAVARGILVSLCLFAWLALGTFWSRYFVSIERTGGDSHLAFRTASVEPKQSAWEHIASASGGRPVIVIADSWWLYWPLSYLSSGRGDTRVLHGDEISPDDLCAVPANAVWLVEFCDAAAAGQTEDERLAELRRRGRKTVIYDYSGRPLLTVIRAQSESTEN